MRHPRAPDEDEAPDEVLLRRLRLLRKVYLLRALRLYGVPWVALTDFCICGRRLDRMQCPGCLRIPQACDCKNLSFPLFRVQQAEEQRELDDRQTQKEYIADMHDQ